VNLVAIGEQQFRQVGAILTGNSSDQCDTGRHESEIVAVMNGFNSSHVEGDLFRRVSRERAL
jgi:hypothetical protein